MKLQRILTSICAIVLCTAIAMAQSSGDKLYSQGLQLQKTITIPSQNQAISKFQSAKKMYDSSAKKAQCDQAIQVSQGIIKHLKSCAPKPQVKPGKDSKDDTVEEIIPSLEVGPANTAFDVSCEANSIQVAVSTNQEDWDVAPVSDGNKIFAQATKRDSKIFIYVMPNNTFESRTQKFNVTAGNLTKEITITQSGIDAKLYVNKGFVKFKAKGDKQKVEVMCNSTLYYPSNSYENWYIASKPDWVNVSINQRGQGLSGSGVDSSIKKATITLVASSIVGTRDAYSGRQGEVVIKSGESTVSIYVSQPGK